MDLCLVLYYNVAVLTSSASSASIIHDTCLKTLWISFPSPSTSSTASYAIVGIAVTPGLTSMITKTGSCLQNCLNSSFIYEFQ